jgi:hypothetical protein
MYPKYRLRRKEIPGSDGFAAALDFEFSDPAVTAAWAWLQANNPQFTSTLQGPTSRVKISRHSPYWDQVVTDIGRLRPAHCDAHGHWYADGVWIDYPGDAAEIVALYDRIMARLATAVPTPFDCAGRRDGCRAKVAQRGDYCPSCMMDEL